MQTRVINNLIVLILMGLSVLFAGCGGGVVKKQIVQTGGNESFIEVIINDENIKDQKYGSDLVDKLKSVLGGSFGNVSVRTGYDTLRTGQIILIPKSLELSISGLFRQVILDDSETLSDIRANANLQLRILYEADPVYYNFNALGTYYPSHWERFACILTCGVTAFAGDELWSRIATNRALMTIAIRLHNKITSSNEFQTYAEYAKINKTKPAKINISCQLMDANSLFPNNTIDAAEKSTITATITNDGKGTAFNVTLTTESKSSNISFPSSLPVGDIKPGESKTVTIPITADLSLATGTANFLITAREKRGYDSRPVELQVATARLLRPEFAIASCKINDSSGLASGDGDATPENNEIIELNPFIKNSGEGDGLQVSVKLTGVSSGIEIVKDRDELASVGRDGVSKATLAFKVPRTYTQPDIRYTITVTDIRDMKTEKSYSIPFAAKAPVLACSYQVFDNNNREAPGLENGKSYLLKLTPKNSGSNLAEGVKVRLNAQTSKVDIGRFDSHVGRLRAGNQGGTVTIPFSLDRSYSEPSLEFDLSITQDSFSGLSRKITLPVIVSQPKLSCQSVLLNGIGEKAVSQNSHPNFRVSVSNDGSLDAADVTVHFRVDREDIAFEKTERIGTVKAGESQYRDFTFFVRGDTKAGELPVLVETSQADFAGIEKQLVFRLERQTALVQKVTASGGDAVQAGGAVYAAPPQLYVNSPNRDVETYAKVIDLHGSVITFGAGNAVQEMAVLVNGRPLKLIPVTEKIRLGVDQLTKRVEEKNKVVFDGQISLDPEVNEIEIRCSDRNNRENNHIIRVTRKARLGNIYAVVVGISRFAEPSLDLEYAASDAKSFYNFLRSEAGGGLVENRVRLLTDAQANRAAIIKALTKFLGKAGPDDTVEIYLATHGLVDAGDGILYYLSHNSDIDNLLGTAFSTSDFEKIVKNNIRAGKVIIYLDACHSGLSGLSKSMYARRGVGVLEVNQKINSLAAQLSKSATGVTTFSASSASGYSLEDAKWDGGVFTYHLLKGLRGAANEDHNEWVTISELENYLTRQILIDTDGKQKPKVNGTLVGETPVAKVSAFSQ